MPIRTLASGGTQCVWPKSFCHNLLHWEIDSSRSETIQTPTMTRPADVARPVARMVELRAVQAGFPLYGSVGLEGGQTYSHALLEGHGTLVRPELLTPLLDRRAPSRGRFVTQLRLPVAAHPMRCIVQRSGVAFRLHDLRRTVRTRLAEMGIPENVAEAVLGHTLPRLIRTYNRHEPVPEMRAALEAWSARLEAIVNGTARLAEVVAFARA